MARSAKSRLERLEQDTTQRSRGLMTVYSADEPDKPRYYRKPADSHAVFLVEIAEDEGWAYYTEEELQSLLDDGWQVLTFVRGGRLRGLSEGG